VQRGTIIQLVWVGALTPGMLAVPTPVVPSPPTPTPVRSISTLVI
jgi:hypothetical protein